MHFDNQLEDVIRRVDAMSRILQQSAAQPEIKPPEPPDIHSQQKKLHTILWMLNAQVSLHCAYHRSNAILPPNE